MCPGFSDAAKVKKSSNVAANFLCDNSSYMLGVDNKENPSRTVQCFAAAKDLHLRLLSQVSSPAAQAIVRYFETWDPTQAAFHPVLQADLPDLLKGGDLTFWYNGALAADDAEIKMAWQRFQEKRGTRIWAGNILGDRALWTASSASCKH